MNFIDQTLGAGSSIVLTTAHLRLDDGHSERRMSRWTAVLGVPDTNVPREGIKTFLKFFAVHGKRFSIDQIVEYLRAVDLSREVSQPWFVRGTELMAFRHIGEGEFGLFYTRPGASPHRLGIHADLRVPVRYFVRANTVPVLASYASGVIDIWSIRLNSTPAIFAPRANTFGALVGGGEVQYIIPSAARDLEVRPTP